MADPEPIPQCSYIWGVSGGTVKRRCKAFATASDGLCNGHRKAMRGRLRSSLEESKAPRCSYVRADGQPCWQLVSEMGARCGEHDDVRAARRLEYELMTASKQLQEVERKVKEAERRVYLLEDRARALEAQYHDRVQEVHRLVEQAEAAHKAPPKPKAKPSRARV